MHRTEIVVVSTIDALKTLWMFKPYLPFPFRPNLIASDGITETNVMEYLAAVERKAMGIISAMKDDEDSEQGSQGSSRHASRTSVMTEAQEARPTTVCVSLPTTEDIPVMDDDGERPLTIQELQATIMN